MSLFFLIVACFWGSIYVFVPVLAPFAESRGASLTTVGWLISAYGLVQFLLRVPLGAWSDRLGRRRPFVIAGFAAAVAGALGMALVPSPAAMVVFRGLTGVNASMWTVLTVLYAAHFPPEQMGRAMGNAMLATSLTQLGANLGGGLLAEAFGWEAPFWAGAALAVAGMAVVGRWHEAPVDKEPPGLAALLSVGRDRTLLTVSLLAAVLQGVSYLTHHGFTPVFAAHLGASKAQLGLLGFISTGATAMGAWFSGRRTAARWGPRIVVCTGFLLAAAFSFALPGASGFAPLVGFQIGLSLGAGAVLPTLMALSIQKIAPERRATAMGFFQSIYALGMFAGPALGGFLGQQWGLAAVFSAAGALALLGAAGSSLSLERRP